MSESGKIRIPLREWRSKDWEEERERRASLATEERDTKTIAGKFAEALGCLEDAICHLGQVNEQYDMEEHIDDVRLVTEYGLRPCNPALDFWLQADLAEGALQVILDRLQRVEPLAPKEEVKV